MKVSLRKLTEYMLCPRNRVLWESDPMRPVFRLRASKFRKAVGLYFHFGFDMGRQVLVELVEKAGNPGIAGIYRQAQSWYNGFDRIVQEGAMPFLPKGRRLKATAGRHTVTLDVPLVEDLGDQGMAAWVFFDFVETELSPDQFELAVQVTKWLLASQSERFAQVVFYVPGTGSIRRVTVSGSDAEWPVDQLILWVQRFEDDRVHAMKPGKHCFHCWHYKQRSCDGGGLRTKRKAG